jgi:hypothetical protein
MDAEYLGRLRAFQESLPKAVNADSVATVAPEGLRLTSEQEDIAARLAALDPALGISYQQVLADVVQVRDTYVGPAGEIREVLRGAIMQLGPDDEVIVQSWFKGHDGKPSHAERIRYALQQNHATEDEQILKADDILDAKIGQLGR